MKPIKNWKASKRAGGKGNPSNKERVRRVEKVLLDYYEVQEGKLFYDYQEICLIDLMSNLLHYAASQGIEPKRLLRVALTHFEYER